MIEIKVNKQLLQQYLKSSTRKVVTLKVMTNVQTEIHQRSDSSNLKTLVQCLKDMEGISPLYESLCINEFHIPLYLLLIVDGYGQNKIIGMHLHEYKSDNYR